MKKLTYPEFCEIMRKHEESQTDYKTYKAITGVIVYKASNWPKKYSLKQRSYRVSSNNRAFQPDKIARSIFGYCLDESTDQGVRLDWYGWKVDYCYFE